MNESVIAMIDKLHARLDDLADVVKEIPFELSDYDKKLDRIDDQVYLLEVELEKKLKSSIPLKPVEKEASENMDQAVQAESAVKVETGEADSIHVTSEDSETSSKPPAVKQTAEAKDADEIDDDEEEEGFLTDSAKETIAGATKKLNEIYREGKDVVGEFSEAFGDIKDVFGKNPFKRR